MDLRQRPVDVAKDRTLLLELHCLANYESDAPWARRMSYGEYREKWLSTRQPDSFLDHLSESQNDPHTVAEIWEAESGDPVAFVWAVRWEVEGYDVVMCEVKDVAVDTNYHRQGIGSQMLAYVEEKARAYGADVMRSDTGIENVGSQKLHEKCGFATHRIEYEKVLK